MELAPQVGSVGWGCRDRAEVAKARRRLGLSSVFSFIMPTWGCL